MAFQNLANPFSALKNKRVVVTRAWHQSADFSQKLEAAGAKVLLYPCVQIVPPDDETSFDAAIEQLARGEFDWLVLTSQNTVLALAPKIKDNLTAKVAAVGTSTARAAKDFLGADITAIPKVYDADSLAELLRDCRNQRIFLPQADIASPILKQKLEQSSAQVTAVVAYKTVKGSGGVHFMTELSKAPIDVITFASPSAVTYFLERLNDDGGNLNAIAGVCVACIGHVTQKAARENGLQVDVSPKQHTVDGLIEALVEHFS